MLINQSINCNRPRQVRFKIQHDNRERMIVYTFNELLPLLIAKTGQMYTINETYNSNDTIEHNIRKVRKGERARERERESALRVVSIEGKRYLWSWSQLGRDKKETGLI